MLKYWKIGFWQNNKWIWVNEKCAQFWGNMFGRHTIINVKYSGNQRDMKYFCYSKIFGFISNHFWDLHFWTYCRLKKTEKNRNVILKRNKKVKVFLYFVPDTVLILLNISFVHYKDLRLIFNAHFNYFVGCLVCLVLELLSIWSS